jgi:hypothetical protein
MNPWMKRAVVWFVAGIATVVVMYLPVREARRCAVESGQQSLLAQTEDQLSNFYVSHRRYPDSLENMHFEFHDGADEATLERLEYFTDGQHYRLVTKSDFDGSEISVCK